MKKIRMTILKPKPHLVEIEELESNQLRVRMTQVGTGLTHFLVIDHDVGKTEKILDRLTFNSAGVPQFYDEKKEHVLATGYSGFQERVERMKTKFHEERTRFETLRTSQKLRSAFRARAIKRQLTDAIESQTNGLDGFDEQVCSPVWRSRIQLLREELREARASRDLMEGFFERKQQVERKQVEEEEVEEEMNISRTNSTVSTMTTRSEISEIRVMSDLELEEEEEGEEDEEVVLVEEQKQTTISVPPETEEEEKVDTITIVEEEQEMVTLKDECRERDRRLMRRQRKRFLKRKRRRERKAKEAHEAFMKVRPKSPISKDDVRSVRVPGVRAHSPTHTTRHILTRTHLEHVTGT